MSHLAETLADFTSQTTFDTIPAASRERVKYFILDGIGVALAASVLRPGPQSWLWPLP